MSGVELREVTGAFERLVRLALGLDEGAEVKATIARGDRGIRLESLSIRGAPVTPEDWATLARAELVQDMSGSMLS